MKKGRNKSFNRESGQTSIFSALNNLKTLSESQKKKKEDLSKLIVVHNSDSEPDEKLSDKKVTVKRRLSFCSSHDENSADQFSTPSPPKNKIITLNKPNVFSTPISHIRQLQDSFSSPLNVSNITIEENNNLNKSIKKSSSCEDLDSDSDTIILEDQHLRTTFKTESSVSTFSCDVSPNKSDGSIIGVVQINDIDFCTIDLTSYDLDSTELIGETDAQSEHSVSTSETSKPLVRSPIKKIPKKVLKKENKSINTTYLTALRDLFSIFDESPHFANIISEEKDILKIFCSSDVDQNCQYVCLKLLTWKNKWYNVFKFCEKINLHMEEQEVLKLHNWLQDNFIVDTDCTKEEISSLLNRLDMNDIQEIHNKFRLKKATTKEDRIKNLLKFSKSQSTLLSTKSSRDLLLKEIKQKMGKCVKIKKEFQDSFYNIYLLATFTNGAFANITDYFSNILGLKMCFPSYRVEEYNVFSDRNDFLSFAKARKFDDEYENAFLTKNDVEALQISEEIFKEIVKFENVSEDTSHYVDAPHLKKYSAKSVYIRTLCKAVAYLSTKHPLRVKIWLEYMIEKIKSHRIGDWYYHLTWIHMKYVHPPDYDYAAKLVIKALKEEKDYLSELQVLNLRQRSEQLQSGKKYKTDQLFHDSMAELLPPPLEEFRTITVDAQTLRGNEMGRKRSYIKNDQDGNKTFMSVENTALDYYIDECGYTDGRHCEGAIIHALFALFFWDIIYDPDPPVPGTFLSKIQQIPLDLNSPYFYTNRKSLIDKRLEQISSEWSSEELLEFVKDIYWKHSSEAGISKIDSIIPETEASGLLETLVDCIGRGVLSKIFERLVRNVRGHRSGMPDLLIWNVEQKTAKFVEVKGEGDRLRPNQELWLSYLQSIGADIEVCHVHSIGSKRKKR